MRINQIEPWVDTEEEKEVLSVLRSGWITEATRTRQFESSIARFVGSEHCTALSNGTVSLFTGLAALGIGRGSDVIVPDFTMVASPNAVVLAGARPVFVDIDRETLCLNLDEVEASITRETKAVMPVPINGRAPDMDRLLQIANDHKLFIVEDAAQALGCYFKGKHLGTFGDVGSFSFSTPKVISTGQGGALVTGSEELYESIVRLKDFGRADRSSSDYYAVGYNFKFTDLQAAIGIAQMKKLPWRLQRKKDMYRLYQELLCDTQQVSFLRTDLSQTSPWFIDIIVPDPRPLQAFLTRQGIETREFYPAIHETKPYKSPKKFRNSAWAARHGLWLPSSSFLTNQDIHLVCDAIRDFYEDN